MTQSGKTLAHYAVIRSLERSPQTFKQLLESCPFALSRSTPDTTSQDGIKSSCEA